jgi:hypothetical protein
MARIWTYAARHKSGSSVMVLHRLDGGDRRHAGVCRCRGARSEPVLPSHRGGSGSTIARRFGKRCRHDRLHGRGRRLSRCSRSTAKRSIACRRCSSLRLARAGAVLSSSAMSTSFLTRRTSGRCSQEDPRSDGLPRVAGQHQEGGMAQVSASGLLTDARSDRQRRRESTLFGHSPLPCAANHNPIPEFPNGFLTVCSGSSAQTARSSTST